VVVGPEQPLCAGIIDALQAADLPSVGPRKDAARLEGSKIFAKQIMQAAKIPTAAYQGFTRADEAKKFIVNSCWSGFVIKADELASGKGVLVCKDRRAALDAVESLSGGSHLGRPITQFLVEELLIGKEVSSFYLCLGEQYIPLGHVCDYKRLDDGDQGPNTGGMGAYSPVPWLSAEAREEIEQGVVKPLLREMKQGNSAFSGFLFVGSMVTSAGVKVLEFNVRLGDPETQCLLPLLGVPLLPALKAVAYSDHEGFSRERARHQAAQSVGAAVHVVCAAEGYPGVGGQEIRQGDLLSVNEGFFSPSCRLTMAGVRSSAQGLVTQGGRILGVTGIGDSIAAARAAAYGGVKHVTYSGKKFRTDI
jgi:phosphoribosylamine--glycine ligase